MNILHYTVACEQVLCLGKKIARFRCLHERFETDGVAPPNTPLDFVTLPGVDGTFCEVRLIKTCFYPFSGTSFYPLKD